MTTEPPTAPHNTGPASPAARKPMSRRRFLAVVGATAGAAGIAGLAGRRLLGGPSNPAPPAAASLAGLMLADPGVEIVEVEPGFADAAVWNDQLLTLRADPAGTGIILRSETDGAEHPVDAPPDFTARCIGTIGTSLAIGGHRTRYTDTQVFESGPDYLELVAQGGIDATPLLEEPARISPSSYEHRYREFLPYCTLSNDLAMWSSFDIYEPDASGGSCATILESQAAVAIERYQDAEVPDSIYDVALIHVGPSRRETAAHLSASYRVDHGHVWGNTHDGSQSLLIIVDRQGTRVLSADGLQLAAIDPARELLGVRATEHVIEAFASSGEAGRQVLAYRHGDLVAAVDISKSVPVLHRFAADATISSPNGPATIVGAKENI